MNKVILIGNLTRDPEVGQTPNGVSVCKFSIAVNRNFTNSNGERDVDYFNIVAWRQLGDNCGKFLSKGKKCAICGSIQTRTWEDDEGNSHRVTEVIADEVEFLSPKNESGQNTNSAPSAPPKSKFADMQPADDDDLPF